MTRILVWGVGLGPLAAVLLMVTDANPSGYVSVGILSAGVAALSVVLSGKIVVPTFAYNRERDRADYWQSEALRVNQALVDKYVPALDASAHALAESTATVKEALQVIARQT